MRLTFSIRYYWLCLLCLFMVQSSLAQATPAITKTESAQTTAKPTQTETKRANQEQRASDSETPKNDDGGLGENNATPSVVDQTLLSFTLSNGTRLTGRIVRENKLTGQLDILLISGERRSIFRSDIAVQSKVQQKPVNVVNGKIWEDNPNRTRHLWSPSAMPLKKGEGYLSQKEFVFTSYSVGLTDNFAILVGTLVPALFAGPEGLNVIGAIKVADQVRDKIYIGGGIETMVIPRAGVAGVPFASFTYGEPDAQVSLNLGKPFALDSDSADFGTALVSVSGMWRFRGDFGLVSENIFLPEVKTSDGWGMLSVHGLAFRSIRESTAWDLGFVSITGFGGFIPIPWFDWTWHFSP